MLTPLLEAFGLPTAHNGKPDFESLIASKIRDGSIKAYGMGERLEVPPSESKARDFLLENGWRFKNGYFVAKPETFSRYAKRLQAAVMDNKNNAVTLKALADARISQIMETVQQGDIFIPQSEIDQFTQIAKNDFQTTKTNLGISIEWNDDIASSLQDRINENYKKNFAGFTEKQAQEIRSWVHERFVNGDLSKKSMVEYFTEQYEISKERARFWARQELSMFVSTLKTEQMNAAGYRYYEWVAVMDNRTRDDHRDLHGSLQDTYNPPVVDLRTGRRGNPGMDFNCRCFAKFITEEEYLERQNELSE